MYSMEMLGGYELLVCRDELVMAVQNLSHIPARLHQTHQNMILSQSGLSEQIL